MKIKFFSLLNLSEHGAVCSIIKLDKYRIMLGTFLFQSQNQSNPELDCGISERYDYSVYQRHQKFFPFPLLLITFLRKIKKVNIILLSHAEIQYHGALPYLFFELGCQVIITLKVPTKGDYRQKCIQHCQFQICLWSTCSISF